MPPKRSKEKILTVAQVKKMLDSLDEDKLDQLQRRSLDYASKFSRIDPKNVTALVKNLIEKFELEMEEAVQLVNCMPKSIEEVRVFLAGGRKIVETSKLQAILSVLDQYRKKE
ncbi:MAG: RNA polymerase Rpb4 [Candidatus Bathyarchaeota archaeon]|jgi:DNA-directed RNA polymerase subunit F|nr:RNA polymerase Rpb4 [Candidatus Bathyarchaeota archaeon]